ncbi:hypothetical protein [Nostoc sp. UHCC 0251]|uniref:hypothetical protein n=1 Tax=Nostoc sp. UHCC 0251 TaxID=3110240 RepID=UPI002B1FEC2C|nr:hypothetical protein [Nostoc sp. UHCC 0251]MEA5625217.1 hypothetical protein [Nostoc sp. UHCC 0251]
MSIWTENLIAIAFEVIILTEYSTTLALRSQIIKVIVIQVKLAVFNIYENN